MFLKNKRLSFKIGLVFAALHFCLFLLTMGFFLYATIPFPHGGVLQIMIFSPFFTLDFFLLPLFKGGPIAGLARLLGSFFSGKSALPAVIILLVITFGILGTLVWFLIPILIANLFRPKSLKIRIISIILLIYPTFILFSTITREFRRDVASSRRYEGIDYANKGKYDEAIAKFNESIQINSAPAYSAYTNRGLAYAEKGNLDQAISDHSQAIEIYPKKHNAVYNEAYYNRGRAYQRKGDLEQAISDFNKSIEDEVNHALPYYYRGLAYAEKGNLDQAISDYDKAISTFDYNKNKRNPDYYNPKYAVVYFTEAISSAEYARVYYNRGLAHAKKGNYDQAVSDYNKAVEIDSNLAGIYNSRAQVYFLKQQYDQAWKDLHKAEALGHKVDSEFLEKLKKASGREK